MLNTIKIKIDKEHNLDRNDYTIARSNENDVIQMEITLDESLVDNWVFIDFIKPDGTKLKTPKLNIEDNIATYNLPSGLIDLEGELGVQIVLQNEEGQVWKSEIKEFAINKSINATDDIQEKEDFITNAQTLLNEIENGLTPSIGENGNWFILGADTGKSSKGATGESGKDGYTPVKGTDYFDGKNGKDGDDYVITNEDYEEIGSIVEENIQPTIDEIKAISEHAETIARGRATGYVFDTLDDLELWLQDENNVSSLTLGDNFYIRATDVPDYWWDGTTKQQLEAEKPDFSNYVKNTDYATSSKAGLLRPANGLFTSGSTGELLISKASNAQIDAKTDNYYPIVPSNLDYAVKSVVGGHVTLTQAEYDALTTKDENAYYYIVEE